MKKRNNNLVKFKKIPRSGIILIIVGIVMLALAVLLAIFYQPVSASGESSAEFTATADTQKQLIYPSAAAVNTWSNCVGGASAGNVYDSQSTVGWYCSGSQANKYYNIRSIIGWDVSSVNITDVDITSATVEIWAEKGGTYGEYPYFGLWKTRTAGTTVVAGDYNSAYSEQGKINVSDYVNYTDLPASYDWVTFNILTERMDDFLTPDANGYVWVTLSTLNDFTTNAPSYDAGQSCKMSGTVGSYAKLTIYYVEATPDREIVYDLNAATDNETTGNEVADNITWESPRAGYADEGMYFKCNGDSGASIELILVDEDNNELDSVTDSIRTDGNYDWVVDLPDNFAGFVRVYEDNFNLHSDWGYQMPKPDSDQINNTVYAVNTEYPQYDFMFTRYLTYENDPFVIHWKTNVQSDELGSHEFRIYSNGDNTTDGTYYQKTLEWLNDNYWNANASNAFLSGWRYVIMTPKIEGSGFETYDGMIIDMDKNYSVATSGFFQGVIVDTSDNTVLADSHSCYWYIPAEIDGIITRLDSATYKKGGDITIQVQLGEACKADDNLPSLTMQILDSGESTIDTEYATVSSGYQDFTMSAPTTAGDYEVRFTFSGDPTWSYIHDIPFTVEGGASITGGQSIIDMIQDFIRDRGLDNPAGYWLVTLLGMVLLFLIAYKSEVLRVVFPLVFLGFMLIMNYIDKWLIILLALGAGLTLFGIFRHKTHGGGG